MEKMKQVSSVRCTNTILFASRISISNDIKSLNDLVGVNTPPTQGTASGRHEGARQQHMTRPVWDELGMLRHFREQNAQALGYHHVCQLLDDVVFEGSNGSHICIVAKLMGATAQDIYACLPGSMPLFLVKRISKHLLLTLQYMHNDCGVVHTGRDSCSHLY